MSFDRGRRSFIGKAVVSTAATGMGLALPWRRLLAAYPPCAPMGPVWGDLPLPPMGQPLLWPSAPDLKILEIHLYGGLSPWETFYVRPPGAMDRFRGFNAEMAAINWGTCDDLTDTEPAPFGTDALGAQVYWSRFTKPLWSAGILSKTRVVVLKHDLLPHEAAIPYALTGLRLGRPNLAGLGAYIQRRALALDQNCATSQAIPYSYVCWPSQINFPTDNLQASAAIGTHPGSSRPLVLRIGGNATPFLTGLGRPGVSSQFDGLLNQYRGQYRDKLRVGGNRVRSKGFDAYDSSADYLLGSRALQTLLQGSPLASAVRTDSACPDLFMDGAVPNVPGHAIRIAAYLLSQAGPRYVCVVDNGLHENSNGGGYDTHNSRHIDYQSSNLWNVLRTLRDLVDHGTLNLSTTMVVLTTEFGRTPARAGAGRDHWPDGYVNVLIGGPVTRGISGAIQDATGAADPANHFNPTDLRAAILMAAGINPFAEGGFNVGDVTVGAMDPYTACLNFKRQVLGA